MRDDVVEGGEEAGWPQQMKERGVTKLKMQNFEASADLYTGNPQSS